MHRQSDANNFSPMKQIIIHVLKIILTSSLPIAALAHETTLPDSQLTLLQQKTAEVHTLHIMLASALVIIILLCMLLWRNIRIIRTLKKKNRVVINSIKPPSPDDTNKQLFERLESIVISRKLYLDRSLSRDDFAKLIGVDKNRFGQILKEQAHTNITGYLNNLRLEDAVKMLIENPESTISEITEACALPNTSTFYRLFKEKFRMTPIEFRDAGNYDI